MQDSIQNKAIRIGTRGSKLALWQAEHAAARLQAAGLQTELVIISTKGDQVLDRSLDKIGSKGVFTEELEISPNDLKIDVYRSSGPGGQSVNTTDSAVRITHLPTGIVVAMQNEKSQLQNREAGMRVLRARILAHQQEQIDAANSEQRKSQIRTMDRSERIRTYNYPENRIADHRTGYKAYNLDQVMNGDLEPVIQSAIEMDEQARLDAIGD